MLDIQLQDKSGFNYAGLIYKYKNRTNGLEIQVDNSLSWRNGSAHGQGLKSLQDYLKEFKK